MIRPSRVMPAAGSNTAQQLRRLYVDFEQALDAGDWAALGDLDTKLQRALPKLQKQPLGAEAKAELAKLNTLYSKMITEGQGEKARIRLQLSQQEATKQGVMAYLGHHE
ncbi:hypothetical protein L4D06_17560 [Enterovibrio makurazakiensis]|uniref:hypothetical protein n=1 Tax=Enterovibrio makurazakiensis TaxID=2910232 RepID=UPI003D19C5B5